MHSEPSVCNLNQEPERNLDSTGCAIRLLTDHFDMFFLNE